MAVVPVAALVLATGAAAKVVKVCCVPKDVPALLTASMLKKYWVPGARPVSAAVSAVLEVPVAVGVEPFTVVTVPVQFPIVLEVL